MWIYIPVESEDQESWVGKINGPDREQRWWSFEVIRHVDPKDLGDVSLFRDKICIKGLLDHQRSCTLIGPILSSINPGSLGVRIGFMRLKLAGTFQALLTDLAVGDARERQFSGFSFSSEAFTVWYSNKQIRTDYDFEQRRHAVDIEKATTEEVLVDGLGKMTLTKGVTVSTEGYSSRLASDAILRVDFDELLGLEELQNIAFSVEKIFGFLIGFRGEPSKIKVWLDKKYKVGEHELPYEGTLEIGGAKFSPDSVPSRYECLHLNGRGDVSMKHIIETFLKDRDDFMTRIYGIEFCRFFSNNISDKFSVIMPLYEEYIRKKFTTEEEKSYIDAQKDFFAWVEKSDDLRVKEFSRKHVVVKDKKSPSLRKLISESISYINKKGFCFPAGYAERIQVRRGRTFHSSGDFEKQEVQKFAFEVRAITGLLLLHTLDDLGVDLKNLTKQYHGLGDLQGFFCAPKPFGEQGATPGDSGPK